MTLFRCLALLLAAGLVAPASAEPEKKPEAPRYELRREHDPDGIGKFYMGREIAQVMGHEGIGWLERPEREKEEEPAKLIDVLKLKEGMVVADVGAGSGAIQVEILSSYCPGGICLSGTNNFGTYTAAKGDGGGWGGVFDVTYLSPAILAFFGDSTDLVDPNGGTAFTTHNNTWRAGGTASSAQFGSGTITLQTTPVPEPGTLALIGTGFLGLGHLLRRKLT